MRSFTGRVATVWATLFYTMAVLDGLIYELGHLMGRSKVRQIRAVPSAVRALQKRLEMAFAPETAVARYVVAGHAQLEILAKSLSTKEEQVNFFLKIQKNQNFSYNFL